MGLMAAIKVTMQQVKAMKADSIEPGPIKVRAGYWNWVGRFQNKLQLTIGAADVPLIYVIREQHKAGWVAPQEEHQDVYAMRRDGPEFAQDNLAVYTMLYNCCNHERAVG
jgi:hypothetical protein